MKLYNLCKKKDYKEFEKKFSVCLGLNYKKHFEYHYVIGYNHIEDYFIYRLDGPSYKRIYGTNPIFVVGDSAVSEKEYWEHSDVKAYAYLKEHPELEGFI